MPTNMDINKNKDAANPVFEFSLPRHEVDVDIAVGEFGEISVPVEVVEVGSDTVTFRKRGKATAQDVFRSEPLSSMRERIGEVEDEEEPLKKDNE